MLNRFMKIRSELLEAADATGASVTIDRRKAIKVKVERYVRMLKEIEDVTKILQTDRASLRNCRLYAGTLYETVCENREDEDSIWFRCQLKNEYIGINSGFSRCCF